MPTANSEQSTQQAMPSPVLHQQHLQILSIVNKELLEAVWQRVASLLVASVTDVCHPHSALELSTHPGVNTLGPPPAFLSTQICNRLSFAM